MKFAHDTEVPVARSRGEIDHLLQRWRCDLIQWTDDFKAGVVTLRFRWTFETVPYAARMQIRLPGDQVLRRDFKRPPTADQLERARQQRWRALHRVLLLALKAQFNAVDAGLLTAVEAFLPHLEVQGGRTIAEAAIPQLRVLIAGEQPLLPGPRP